LDRPPGEESVEGLATGRERAAEFRALFEDDRAFRDWYDRAVPRVYGYLFDRCGGLRTVAEELAQEAFIEAVRHRRRFDGRSDPITWVISIARHKLADHYRRLAREERRHLRLVSASSAEEGWPDRWYTTESREVVLRALRGLPAMQRAALAFHYMDELSVVETARELGKTEAAVESLLSRGREGFCRALAENRQEAEDA
jgi:RNA polymerase sigma-70 factor, ECF subfamily